MTAIEKTWDDVQREEMARIDERFEEIHALGRAVELKTNAIEDVACLFVLAGCIYAMPFCVAWLEKIFG